MANVWTSPDEYAFHPDNIPYIINLDTGMVLSIKNDATVSGSEVIEARPKRSPGQYWLFKGVFFYPKIIPQKTLDHFKNTVCI